MPRAAWGVANEDSSCIYRKTNSRLGSRPALLLTCIWKQVQAFSKKHFIAAWRIETGRFQNTSFFVILIHSPLCSCIWCIFTSTSCFFSMHSTCQCGGSYLVLPSLSALCWASVWADRICLTLGREMSLLVCGNIFLSTSFHQILCAFRWCFIMIFRC